MYENYTEKWVFVIYLFIHIIYLFYSLSTKALYAPGELEGLNKRCVYIE